MNERFYKVLNADGSSFNGGNGKWPLPASRTAKGEWLEVTGELVPCANGLHLCKREQLIRWLGPTIYVAEYEGQLVEDGDKCVVRKARLVRRLDAWDERSARLFAVACARRVQSLMGNQLSIAALDVAELFANGKATKADLAAASAAARATASDAASDAGDAASAEERAWQTEELMRMLGEP